MKNILLKIKWVPVIALLGPIGFSQIVIADTVLIVNSSSDVSTLSASAAKKIFLGKKKTFPNGDLAEPVEQVEGSATRNQFNEKVLSKTDHQLKSYWSKLIFSGKATPPKQVSDDAGVKSWIAKSKNGIGYVDSSQLDNSVKVVLTVN